MGDACDLDIDGDNVTNLLDVDADGDGLIEITTAAELNAIRYNLQGTGLRMNATDNSQATSNGCGNGDDITTCKGYELMANVDLDDLGINRTSGSNWQPIGSCANVSCDGASVFFSGNFNGNDYTISNLRINVTEDLNGVGLFAAAIPGSRLSNVHINGGFIQASSTNLIGGLIGHGNGAIISSSSVRLTEISGNDHIGGLIGRGNLAQISHSSAVINSINSFSRAGGLVGDAGNGMVHSSYAVVDRISGREDVGGLAGSMSSGRDVTSLYSSYAVTERISGDTRNGGGGVGNGPRITLSTSYVVVNLLEVFDGFALGNVGGLIGLSDLNSIITYSYSIVKKLYYTSFTNPPLYNGGLTGIDTFEPTVNNSYYDNKAVNAAGNKIVPHANDAINLAASKNTNELHNSTFESGTVDEPSIYANWALAYCHPTTGEYMELDALGDTPPADFQRAWDLGTTTEYPALNCLRDLTPAQQRELSAAALDDDDNESPVEAYDRIRREAESQ